MNEIPVTASIALGQILTIASALAALVFWRSGALAEIVDMLAKARRIKRLRMLRREEVRLVRQYRTRLLLFVSFLLFLTYGYYCVALGGKNASYFFLDEALDSGAARLAIQNLLAMAARSRWLSIYAFSIVFAEWLLGAWCANNDFDGQFMETGMELPHTRFFQRRRFGNILNLWQERFLYCIEHWGETSFTTHLTMIGREKVSWRDFSAAACDFRGVALSCRFSVASEGTEPRKTTTK